MNPLDQQVSVSPSQKAPARGALRIVLLYAAFSSLWIILSDKGVVWLFRDPDAIHWANTLKGEVFVAVTALLLYGLIARLAGSLNHALELSQERARALQESENLLQESQRIAGLGSYVLDLRTGLWKGSVMCDEVLGIDGRYEHSIEGWLAMVHPDDRAMMMEYLNEGVLTHRRRFDRQYRIIRPSDGVERWVHALGQLVLDGQGRPVILRGTVEDVSDARRADIEIEAARNQLQATLNALPDLLFEVGREGRIYDYHSHRTDLLAAPPALFLGRSFADVVPAEVARVCQLAIDDAAQKGYSSGRRYALTLPQGRCWFELSAAPMQPAGDGNGHFILIARDITERKLAEERLQLAARVFKHAREGITITDTEGTILEVNDAFSRITGYAREEVLGRNPRILRSDRQDKAFYQTMWQELIQSGSWTGEIWNLRKNGELFAELLTISAVPDEEGRTVQYVALFSDITAAKAHQEQLEHMAHFDALTHLPNRLLLSDRLHQAMSQVERRNTQLAVVYLDLDGFKAVNDHHGHDVGDAMLIALAQRMKDTLREGDTLARMGGDEFVAVLIDLESTAHCLPMLMRLLGVACEPVTIGDLSLQISASLGVSFYPQLQEPDADQLLRQADQAMYQAKLAGKNRYHVFDAEMDNHIRGHHESLECIHQALIRSEFVLHYQPKVNLRTGQIVGAEALIRWQHPVRGLLAPVYFLSVIEDHALAVGVGEWVIDTALCQVEHWRQAGLDIPVSVNVGARQLQQPDFVARLTALLAQHPTLSPACLELEILETSALNDMAQVSRVIEECGRIGVRFALDDFGTGYSSLTYLKRLQVALLKVDQSFVRDMLEDPEDLAILKGVIGLAQAFRREVLAEGVETAAHGAALLQLGCELAQGYGIARPMPGEALPAWAGAWSPDPAWCECTVSP